MTSDDKNGPNADAIQWLVRASELEEQGGGFPGVTGIARHLRPRALDNIPSEFRDWKTVEEAIRPEVPKKFIEDVRNAISANLLAPAIQMMWNAVVDDLRSKVLAFGLQYFAALDGMPLIRDRDDLITRVTPYQLLNGCHSLGILNREAYVHLQYCFRLVHGYAASAEFTSRIDRLEVLNFLKNSVKYSLSVSGPSPGLDMKGMFAFIDSRIVTDEDLSKLERFLSGEQSAASTLVRVLFRRYLEQDSSAGGIRDANILRLFPTAWATANEATKHAIAAEYVAARLTANNDQAFRAWSLLLHVRGARYLPDSILASSIEQVATALLAAHNGWNNFAAEAEPANALLTLGSRIPVEARDVYVKAVVICYLGNPYGVSWMALPALEQMIAGFDSSVATRAVELIQSDAELQSTLMSPAPAARLSELLRHLRDRILDPRTLAVVDRLVRLRPEEVQHKLLTNYAG